MFISDLALKLRLNAREAPAPTLERLIRESAREFFAKSRVWRQTFSGAITAGTEAYDLNLSAGSLALTINYAKLRENGSELTYLKDAAKAYHSYEALTDASIPEAISLVDDNTFQLYPVPSADDTVELRVVLSITRSATEIDDEVVEEFEDPIVDGALARLYEIPNETWSNLQLAGYHRTKFLRATEEARLRGQEARTPGTPVSSFSW